MWRRLLTTQEGRAQSRTWEAAFGAAQSNLLYLPLGQLLFQSSLLSAEKLTTGHALLPHRWLGIHQDCA